MSQTIEGAVKINIPPLLRILLNSFSASRGSVKCSKTSIHIIASKESLSTGILAISLMISISL